jgi:hypothetical protein
MVFWVVTPCSSGRALLLPAFAGFLLDIYITLKMEAIRSSRTSGFLRTTRSYNPKDRDFRTYMPNTTANRGNTVKLYSVGGRFESRIGP